MGEAIGTALFIGGPKDGDLLPVCDDSPEVFRAPVPVALPQGQWTKPPGVIGAEQIQVCEYRRETFHTPDTDFHFWLAPDLSPDDLMVRLITTYHAAILRTPHSTLRQQAAALLDPTGDR